MLIKSIGRPCGPCCSSKKSIPLQTSCLLIGFFEIYFGCIVLSASVGTFTGKISHGEQLRYGADYWDRSSWGTSWMWYSYGWQAICYYIFSVLGGILLLAHHKRQTKWCLIWVIGAVVTQLVSILGILFMLDYLHLHPYHFLVAFMTILRAYFVWVILAFYREIVTYPGGYPPAQESLDVTESKDGQEVEATEPEVAAIKSSVKYVGDG